MVAASDRMRWSFGTLVVIALLLLAITTGQSSAAEFQIKTLSDTPLEFSQLDSGICTHELSGTIVRGSAEKVKEAILSLPGQDHDDKNFVICMNSSGGNLNEGFLIGKLIFENYFGTFVPENAECSSACAIAFMHGFVGIYDKFKPFRMLHPNGKLGFHAPSLPISSDMTTEVPMAMVNSAYDGALKTIAQIVDGAISSDPETDFIPLGLLREMLRTPPDEMRYVETLHDAFSWRIDIFPEELRAPQNFDLEVGFYQLCANLGYAVQGATIGDRIVTKELVNLYKTTGHYTAPKSKSGYTLLKFAGQAEEQCHFGYDKARDRFDVFAYREGQQIGNAWLNSVYLFPPTMPLVDLAR